jgi:hypothetical protein
MSPRLTPEDLADRAAALRVRVKGCFDASVLADALVDGLVDNAAGGGEALWLDLRGGLLDDLNRRAAR